MKAIKSGKMKDLKRNMRQIKMNKNKTEYVIMSKRNILKGKTKKNVGECI